ARGAAADQSQARVGLERAEEAVERLAEGRIAEVVEAGTPARGREQTLWGEPNQAPRDDRRHWLPSGAAARTRLPTRVETRGSCHATSPGTPSASSRTRLASERASAPP